MQQGQRLKAIIHLPLRVSDNVNEYMIALYILVRKVDTDFCEWSEAVLGFKNYCIGIIDTV